ncbi:MAG TPA: hypothetical protein VGI47_06110 [Candidatus Binataceae bacterium]
MASIEKHFVAVIGAATAGSEIARILAGRGARVVVFEQNARPYGKIEDGLPRWHVKQRKDEYREIDRRLALPNIDYVPLTRLGRDLDFKEMVEQWGLSGIVLTHGAWRDRPFPVEGADALAGRGLVYQNSFIYWFNHYLESGYDGPRYEIVPATIVQGGGLASFDVVKVLQIEATLRALRQRGIEEQMVRVEREGIEPVLASHHLKWEELRVEPCHLFYRRRALDMPLSDIPPAAPLKRQDALRQARAKILEKAQRKYLFRFDELSLPTGLIVEAGRLSGVQMSRTELADGQVRTVADSAKPVRAPMTISSIGSIPEPIPGIPQRGETYTYADQKAGLLINGPTAVFAAGNVLTGKGNIKDSLDSGTEIGTKIAESYLGLSEERVAIGEGVRLKAQSEAESLSEVVAARPVLSESTIESIMVRVRERQKAVAYEGDYQHWITRMTPEDLE